MGLLTGSLWHYYLLYVLVPIAGIGIYPISYSRLILNWFDRHRGIALGIALSGVGLAGMLLPPLIQGVIATAGWRYAYVAFGLLILLVTLPTALRYLHERPEDRGLAPDGDPPGTHTAEVAARYHGGDTLAHAFTQRVFWQLLVAFGLLGAISMGALTHLAALVGDLGYGPAGISAIMFTYGLAAIVGRVSLRPARGPLLRPLRGDRLHAVADGQHGPAGDGHAGPGAVCRGGDVRPGAGRGV
jgi:MFS family permease